MLTHRQTVLLTMLGVAACVSAPERAVQSPGLGVPVTSEELAGRDISIAPSGAGLPSGRGTAREGALVYEQKCAACHGAKGVGKPADALAGGRGTLASKTPVRTVGSYWPYATTLFDYVRRAMPITNPLSLTNDEVYAVSAYVLFLNGIIDEGSEMNAHSLPLVKMPNRDGFINAWRPRSGD
jgi:S-disulfanyl-L-cysteine oxidoreductase SoxD